MRQCVPTSDRMQEPTPAKPSVSRPVPARLQPKLTLGPVADSHEAEADRISEQVMRMPDARLQRGGGCAICNSQPSHRGHNIVQMKSTEAGDHGQAAAPPVVGEALASPGQPLDPGTRDFMESRFGHDFGGVRIHADAKAAQATQSIQALAFTVGREIAFGAGHYAPHTPTGRKLLAHELTHVIQQDSQTHPSTIQRAITLTGAKDPIPLESGMRGPVLTKGFLLGTWLDRICPDGKWKVDAATGKVTSADQSQFCGAAPVRGKAHHSSSAFPTSCRCLCELTAPGSKNLEVRIDREFAERFGGGATNHASATEMVSVVSDQQHVGIVGAGATAPLSGKGRQQTLPDPPWIILAHEICGHSSFTGSISETRFEHTATHEGNRTSVDIENRIRREHSTISDSLGIRLGRFRAKDAAGKSKMFDGSVLRVGAGEKLAGIALRAGIAKADMLNHIWTFDGNRIADADKDKIKAGDEVLVEGIQWHEVIAKETLTTIAQMWDVPLASLKRANPSVKALAPGNVLLIPAS